MAKQATIESIDAYIAQLPLAAAAAVAEVRALLHGAVPGLSERISYGIPTFELAGRYFLYVAGWKQHISLYPVTDAVLAASGPSFEAYHRGKGTLQFALATPLPLALIRRIVMLRADEARAQ